MDGAAVLTLAKKTWGSDGHQWTTADLMLAGLTPAQMTKFRAAANRDDNRANNPNAVFFLDAEIMTLIAYHESGFNERAHKPPDLKDDSYGLWQINTLGPLWNGVKGKNGVDKKEDLFNPDTNAAVAHRYTTERPGAPARTFQPWTGSWQKAVRDIANGTNAVPVGSLSPGNAIPGVGSTNTTIPNVKGWMDGLGDFFSTITDASFWKRVGIGALGFAVVLGAVVFYNKDTIGGMVGKVPV